MKHPVDQSIQIIESFIEKKENYQAEIESTQFIKKYPEHPFGYLSKASLLLKRESDKAPDQCRDMLWKAIYLSYQRPNFRRYLSIILNELGIYYRRLERFEVCISLYHQSLEYLSPGDHRRRSLIHFNLATSYLVTGQLRQGFEEYKWVYIDRDDLFRYFQQPYWQGEKEPTKTLLLHNEQAYGDLIFFMRLIRELKPYLKKVILEVTPRLIRLVKSSPLLLSDPDDLNSPPDSFFEIVPRPTDNKPHPENVKFDYHANYALLPYYAGVTMETIPNHIPYLRAEPAMIEKWTKFFQPYQNKFKIGINWCGKPTNSKEHLRKVPLEEFLKLADIPGVQLFSLQKFVGLDQLQNNHPVINLDKILDTDTDNAFIDTAAVMTQLDLVISSDTSTAHLAGCLNRPIWILLHKTNEWRWFLERTDSPWYPKVCRLFRQDQPGDWPTVMNNVKSALELEIANAEWVTSGEKSLSGQIEKELSSSIIEEKVINDDLFISQMTQSESKGNIGIPKPTPPTGIPQHDSLSFNNSNNNANNRMVEASPFVTIQNPPWHGAYIDPKIIVDPVYQDQYSQMHYMGAYDGMPRYVEKVTEMIRQTDSKTFLDYGSGKGKQYYGDKIHIHNKWGVEITLYDPAVPSINQLPDRQYDFIYCAEVMEHLTENYIESVLDYIFGHAQKAILLTVSLGKAMKNLPNGENSHSCVKPQEWWVDKFKKYYDKWQCEQRGIVTQFYYTTPAFNGETIITRSKP